LAGSAAVDGSILGSISGDIREFGRFACTSPLIFLPTGGSDFSILCGRFARPCRNTTWDEADALLAFAVQGRDRWSAGFPLGHLGAFFLEGYATKPVLIGLIQRSINIVSGGAIAALVVQDGHPPSAHFKDPNDGAS
ncbi:hypothetical protein BZG21_37865, partial [Escherichia coli]|nr:hypothetical protein [Escherichia coli]